MTARKRLATILAAAALTGFGLAGCRRTESPSPGSPSAQSPAPAGTPPVTELPLEQTPVSSLYEEKPGVLYERAARTPTVSFRPTPTRTPPPYVP